MMAFFCKYYVLSYFIMECAFSKLRKINDFDFQRFNYKVIKSRFIQFVSPYSVCALPWYLYAFFESQPEFLI